MEGLRLLACFAHPDDEAFPVGGTLATYTARGVDVRLVCATLGEEGEIRQAGSATRQTIGEVRLQELRCSCRALGIERPIVLGYRDSGMAGTDANHHGRAFVNAEGEEVVDRLVEVMRNFRPQVVLTFGGDGLYGHPDHIAISKHSTAAFNLAVDSTYRPLRLFYSVRPRGFRTQMALKLREAGVNAPLPSAERQLDGVAPEDIHLEMDVVPQLDRKVRCLLCHRTQMSPERPYSTLSTEVLAEIIGREYFVRGYPPVPSGERLPPDFFHGIAEHRLPEPAP